MAALLFSHDEFSKYPNLETVILSRIKSDLKGDKQTAALRALRNHLNRTHTLQKTVLTMISNTGNATTQELFELMQIAEPTEIQKIYNDLYTTAKKQFTQIASQPVPDVKQMENCEAWVKNGLLTLNQKGLISREDYDAAVADAKDVFNVEKTLIGGVKYIEQTTENISLQKQQAETELTKIRAEHAKAMAELERLRAENDALATKLNETRLQLDDTQKQLAVQTKTLKLTTATLEARNLSLQKIEQAAQNVKGGLLGGSGVNDLKTLIANEAKQK